ncbi:MAG: CotH kinase family protein [Acidobacteria bacterium]|nr:CotH kinase family protein [Acidobacteriota bacterium]
MNSHRLIRAGLLLAALAWANAPAVHAQTSADLFNSQTLHDVRIFIHSKELDQLREHYLENTYYPADFQWGNIRVRDVAVRVRGLASRSAIKPGLEVDFDRYTPGQQFLGLKALVLDNLLPDPAMIREFLSMSLFARVGEPASREAFCRFYINNQYQGVYAIVEAVDAEFVARTLGERDGYLFEKKYVTPFLGEDLGDDVAAYKPLFEARTHQDEPDEALYAPIRDLFREANQPVDDDTWRERVAQYLDLAQFVTHVAIETFLAEEDGVIGASGMANFYFYRSPHQTSHRLLVWDKDLAFHQIDWPIFIRAEDNVLFRRALAFEDLRNLYLDTLEQCARVAAEDEWLAREAERVSGLIADAAHEDVWKPDSNNAYDEATEFVKAFARARSTFVLEEVARTRQEMLAASGVPVAAR